MYKVETKKSKKKTIIALLLVFALVGVVGYGVYSYYWAEGDIAKVADTIYIDSFGVSLYDGDGLGDEVADFMKGDLEVELECEEENSVYTCVSTATVVNRGTSDIIATVTDLQVSAGVYEYDDTLVKSVPVTSYSTNWTNNTKTISGSESGGEYEAFTITVVVNDPSLSSEAVKVTDPDETGGNLKVTATYKMKAEQVH